MRHEVYSLLFAAGLTLAMLLAMELGRRMGRHRAFLVPEKIKAKSGVMEAAVFGLMGLLIAFTFSGAAERFDHRRQLITEEANAVGTAWLRLDLLPESGRQELRGLFRDYLDSRLRIYNLLPDIDAARQEHARTEELQGRIWSAAMEHCRKEEGRPVVILLLPALNQMFDIANSRHAATLMHPPMAIFGLLVFLAMGGALFVGYDLASGTRDLVHFLGFVLALAATVYVIFDLEYPRLGLIRVDDYDRVLLAVRKAMG